MCFLTWFTDSPLRLIGVFVISFGVVLTSFCLAKGHEKTKRFTETLLIRSLIRSPTTQTGEPANPSRTASFAISGEGHVFGNVESSDGTILRLDVRRQTPSAKDVVVLEHSVDTAKGPFDFVGLRQGDYQITIEGIDQIPRKAKIECTIVDKTKPYEKYLALSVAIITSGVVVLMKGL
jgi:hypothetical protein